MSEWERLNKIFDEADEIERLTRLKRESGVSWEEAQRWAIEQWRSRHSDPMTPKGDHEMATDSDQPAFPDRTYRGMTMREWLAGQALIGLLAFSGPRQLTPEEAAKDAFDMADAMIQEAKKGPRDG